MRLLNVDSSYTVFPFTRLSYAMAKKHNKSPEFVLSHMLMLLALATQGKVRYVGSRHKEALSPNIFFLTPLHSGGGKTHLYQMLFGPHVAELNEVTDEYEQARIRYNKSLELKRAEKKKKSKSNELNEHEAHASHEGSLELGEQEQQEPTQPPPVLLSECSLAALKRTMRDQPCTVAVTEGKTQLYRTKEEMMTYVCTLWDGFSFETRDRYKNHPITLPAFNMFLSMQHSALQGYLKKYGDDAVEGGFLYRCFIVQPQAKASPYHAKWYNNDLGLLQCEKEDTEQMEQQFHERITTLMKQNKQRMLTFSPDAESALQGHIQQLKKQERFYQERQMKISGFISKGPEHLRRITVLLHSYSEDGDVITANAVHHAAEILNLYFTIQLDFYDPLQQSALVRDAMQVLNWLQQQTDYKKITRRRILRACRCASDKDALDEQLQYLLDQKHIEITKIGRSEFIRPTHPVGRD